MAGDDDSFASPPTTPAPASQAIGDRGGNLTIDTTTAGTPTTTTMASTASTTAKPLFGGIYHKQVVWIGGPPNEAFTDTTRLKQATPLCLRGLEPSSEIKGYTKRIEGLSTKFKRDDPEFSLLAFGDESLRHMQKHGMDSVFYMKGADSNGKGAEELFTLHTRYTKAQVDKFIKDMLDASTPPHYDEYCIASLDESAHWLLDSLDESLKTAIRPQLASGPTGPQLWMIIVGEVQSESLRRCILLRKKFEGLSLSQFKGENVRDYATAAHSCLLQLERDGQLPPTHLLDIVDHLTNCTVKSAVLEGIHWKG